MTLVTVAALGDGRRVSNGMKVALLASYKKDEPLLRLGRLLTRNQWKLLGSSGTSQYLNENGIPCLDVSNIVGKPILGHRVVTLSREIYAGLLAYTEDDFKELGRTGVQNIDLVYVALYPLEETVADSKSEPEDVIEKTDIGGPTLLRAAAKGRRIALSNPEQIPVLEEWFSRGTPEKERADMVAKFAAAAERRVADYVDASAKYWENRMPHQQ